MDKNKGGMKKSITIMDFVNSIIGAYESGFIDSNLLSLYSLHRCAENYIKDSFDISVKTFSEEWDENLAIECGLPGYDFKVIGEYAVKSDDKPLLNLTEFVTIGQAIHVI